MRLRGAAPVEDRLGACSQVTGSTASADRPPTVRALHPCVWCVQGGHYLLGPDGDQRTTRLRARCEDASQIRLGRVKNNNISLKWWAYSLRRKSDIQEPEPSTHTPNMCPVPRPARLSQANAACAQTQHAAAPCRVQMKQIYVKWTWTGLYVVVSIVQPVADAFTRTRSQR